MQLRESNLLRIVAMYSPTASRGLGFGSKALRKELAPLKELDKAYEANPTEGEHEPTACADSRPLPARQGQNVHPECGKGDKNRSLDRAGYIRKNIVSVRTDYPNRTDNDY